jgi:hypothetical protein
MNLPGKQRILGLALLTSTVAAIGFTVYLSLDPKNYFFDLGEHRASWVYDPRHVALITGLMVAEAACAAAAWFSPRPRAMWIRCLLGLLVLVSWALTVTPFVIHMPLYVLLHHLWVWLLVVMLVLVALGSMLRHLLLHMRQSRLTGRIWTPPARTVR